MYLFFDTETTGLPRNFKAPASDLDNWSRLVQLAFVVTNDEGKIIRKRDYIIKPSGFEIPKEASDIHRITTEIAEDRGIILEDALVLMFFNLKKVTHIVAHNMNFDEKIIEAECIRCKMPEMFKGKEKICTMLSTINFCAISGNYGFKYPKLQELHEKLFGCQFEEAHNARADIEATVKCFFELKKRGLI